jgi:hypothetical protein
MDRIHKIQFVPPPTEKIIHEYRRYDKGMKMFRIKNTDTGILSPLLIRTFPIFTTPHNVLENVSFFR